MALGEAFIHPAADLEATSNRRAQHAFRATPVPSREWNSRALTHPHCRDL